MTVTESLIFVGLMILMLVVFYLRLSKKARLIGLGLIWGSISVVGVVTDENVEVDDDYFRYSQIVSSAPTEEVRQIRMAALGISDDYLEENDPLKDYTLLERFSLIMVLIGLLVPLCLAFVIVIENDNDNDKVRDVLIGLSGFIWVAIFYLLSLSIGLKFFMAFLPVEQQEKVKKLVAAKI